MYTLANTTRGHNLTGSAGHLSTEKKKVKLNQNAPKIVNEQNYGNDKDYVALSWRREFQHVAHQPQGQWCLMFQQQETRPHLPACCRLWPAPPLYQGHAPAWHRRPERNTRSVAHRGAWTLDGNTQRKRTNQQQP